MTTVANLPEFVPISAVAPERRDDAAEAVAVPSHVRGGDRNQSLLGGHGAAKGAVRGAKSQRSGSQTMQHSTATKKNRWERDRSQRPGERVGGSAVAAEAAPPCVTSSEAAQRPQLGPIGRQTTLQGAKSGATRNRLPVGPTEAELLCGYQNTITPAQGWCFDAGPGQHPLPVRSTDEAGGDEHPATCVDNGSVTSPARAGSLAGGAS